MKKKRLLSLLVALALVLGLMPVAMGDTVTSAIDTDYNTATARESDSELFNTAYVRNAGTGASGNGTAQQLEVVVNLRELTEQNGDVYAVVMLAAD